MGVISKGRLIGTVEELREHQDRHLADERFLREYARGEKLYAWELGEARKFKEPIDVETKQGQRTWMTIRPKASEAKTDDSQM